jgi:DNA-binding NtrC family response regulator
LSAPLPHAPTTILVVDDEPVSRRVAYRILSEEGFRVLEAATCAETLDALRQAHGRVDLLMLDVVMPECDGVAVGRRVLEQWPSQRILYMSAHPAEVLARHGHSTLNVPFLAKPYTRGEILAKVKEALGQPRQRKRILVVDDDASIRSSLGKMLTAAGHEVVLAQNGHEATRLWREGGADLVIVDLFMPEKDGLETIIELRAHSPGISIIAMSGGGTARRMDLLPEAKLLGATVTIDKPFTPADMLATVDSVLKDSRPRKA